MTNENQQTQPSTAGQQTTQPSTTGNQPAQRPASTTGGATVVGGATVSQPREGATKAQSEIGPTTYGGPNGPVGHGPNDPETKAAYAAGHPAQGIEHQRAQDAAGNANAPGARAAAQTAQSAQQPAQTAQQPGQPQTTQQATQPGQTRVRMTQDYLGHANGTEVTVDDATAKAWIDAGAAVQASTAGSSTSEQTATRHQG